MQPLARREYPAEIVDPGSGRKAFGRLAHTEPGCLAIRLSAAPGAHAWLQPGRHVVVSAGPQSGVQRVEGRVWSADGGVAWLYVGRGGARPRARKAVRRPCAMPVALRWLRPDYVAGPWVEATAVDISIGGIGLISPTGACVTEKAEVRFLLPNEIEEAEEAAKASDNPPPRVQRHPIAVVARPAFVKKLPGDHLLIGLQFQGMKGQDRMRVAAFAHASPSAAGSRAA